MTHRTLATLSIIGCVIVAALTATVAVPVGRCIDWDASHIVGCNISMIEVPGVMLDSYGIGR